MKQIVFIVILLSGCTSYAQFNSYEPATLKLRNGEVVKGEAKIISYDELKFRKGKKKEVHTYRTLDTFTILENGKEVTYSYMIRAGKPPRLMKIIKEYKGSISLYAVEHFIDKGAEQYQVGVDVNFSPSGVGMTPTVKVNVTDYYVNKGSGYTVINIGNNHPVFGNRHFKKTAKEFFEDCPELLEKIENKEFRRKDIELIVDFYNENCGS